MSSYVSDIIIQSHNIHTHRHNEEQRNLFFLYFLVFHFNSKQKRTRKHIRNLSEKRKKIAHVTLLLIKISFFSLLLFFSAVYGRVNKNIAPVARYLVVIMPLPNHCLDTYTQHKILCVLLTGKWFFFLCWFLLASAHGSCVWMESFHHRYSSKLLCIMLKLSISDEQKKNYSEMNCWHTRWLECDTMYAFWCSGKRNKINDKFDYRLCHSRRMEQVRWSTALQTNMWSAYREPIKRAIQRLISTWGDRLGNMSDYEPFWPNFFWGLFWEESLLVHFAWQCVAE